MSRKGRGPKWSEAILTHNLFLPFAFGFGVREVRIGGIRASMTTGLTTTSFHDRRNIAQSRYRGSLSVLKMRPARTYENMPIMGRLEISWVVRGGAVSPRI